ncbi:MAG: CRISPR-associated endonuclease Cas3'' [Clostridiales bacterium]|nr:CRISPR-associated endonuclease Cas3'' [Clostridiales bacterium]
MENHEYIAHRTEDGRIQTVKAHLEGTAERAERFAADFDAAEWGRWTGLAHDIGKYSSAFQQRINDPDHAPRTDHSTAGALEALRRGAGSGSLCHSRAPCRSARRRLPDGYGG